MGEVKDPGQWDPWGLDCWRFFKVMDLSFSEMRSHFLSVCLSPALLLNQGEWHYYLALLREGATRGSWIQATLPSQVQGRLEVRRR